MTAPASASASATTTPSPATPADGGRASPWQVAILGTGFGGLGMAIRLRRAGRTGLVLFEQGADVGGVWRENSYPGAACDVPSHLYSFSFAPKADWSRTYASQPEILAYLQACARDEGVQPLVRFGCTVTAARFDEAAGLWQLHWQTDDGAAHSGWSRVVVSAVGVLSRPAVPDLPGLAEFAGPVFHSARWRHDVPLDGKRIAVIGTGASAIQFVPRLAAVAGQLTVCQRTAPWILPRDDRAITPAQQARLARWPLLRRLKRLALYVQHDLRAIGFNHLPFLLGPVGRWPALRHLRRQVPDAALRQRLMPGTPIGCKRILISDEFLPSLGRPNVEVLTGAIERVVPRGLRMADGRFVDVEVLVLGTGFEASRFLAPLQVTGRAGQDLHAGWQATGAQAYLGSSVPGFPNFFMLYGPNTNLGHNSIVFMLEAQIEHVMRCLQRLDALGGPAAGARIEVARAPFERFNAWLQRRARRTVFNGCHSWYLDEAGRATVNWPGSTTSFRWRCAHGRLDAYRVSAAG